MLGPRQRQQLVARIFELAPGDTATLFVTLWTYFLRAGLVLAERELQLEYGSRALLPAYRFERKSPSPPEILAKLIDEPGKFDLLCLRWLKGLDDVLQQKSGTFEGVIEGFDRLQRYWIRRRNDFIASQYAKNGCGVTLAERQGGTLWRYCRAFVVLPAEEADRQLDCVSQERWGDPLLHTRLDRARREFSAVCWPLSNALVLDESDRMRLIVRASPDPAIGQTLKAAVDTARAQRATVLLFPELSLAPGDLATLQGILEEEDSADGYPLLTVAGLVHRTVPGGEVNEAVLLGPDGTVLHRQRKLFPFELKDGAMERLEAGQTITVLESAVGNFTILICLDFFNDRVGRLLHQSHANIFLVPSMSDTTGAHDTAAVVYRAQNGALTMLCNRNLAGASSAAQHTFVAAPGTRDGRVIFDKLAEGASHLVYVLEYPDPR